MNINIIQLDRTADIGGVITAHWTASKTEGEYTASGYGAEGFTPDPDAPDFVPFDELTEADVIGWLEAKEGWEEDLEARLDADLANQKNPPVLHGLPWVEPEPDLDAEPEPEPEPAAD